MDHVAFGGFGLLLYNKLLCVYSTILSERERASSAQSSELPFAKTQLVTRIHFSVIATLSDQQTGERKRVLSARIRQSSYLRGGLARSALKFVIASSSALFDCAQHASMMALRMDRV